MHQNKLKAIRGRAAASLLALSLSILPSAVRAAAVEPAPEAVTVIVRAPSVTSDEVISPVLTSAVMAASESMRDAAVSADALLLEYEEKLSYVSSGYFIWPIEGQITSPFGRRHIKGGSSNHRGIDIAANRGDEIAAADAGEIIWSGWDNSYGNFIKIRHDNGLVTCYAHMSERLVEVGDRVKQGEIIGLVGSTGQSTGPHLHFEVRTEKNERVDPIGYLPKK
ncbi:MAG: M23 family metallopeptidase [Oscillospiraceae bacterium]|nr:M23 family metallopeptidase [Oscillospiraceae bacterium]